MALRISFTIDFTMVPEIQSEIISAIASNVAIYIASSRLMLLRSDKYRCTVFKQVDKGGGSENHNDHNMTERYNLKQWRRHG